MFEEGLYESVLWFKLEHHKLKRGFGFGHRAGDKASLTQPRGRASELMAGESTSGHQRGDKAWS